MRRTCHFPSLSRILLRFRTPHIRVWFDVNVIRSILDTVLPSESTSRIVFDLFPLYYTLDRTTTGNRFRTNIFIFLPKNPIRLIRVNAKNNVIDYGERRWRKKSAFSIGLPARAESRKRIAIVLSCARFDVLSLWDGERLRNNILTGKAVLHNSRPLPASCKSR